MPHMFRVIVPVGNIERAAHFHGALDATGQRISPGRHYFDCEGTILACYDPQADGDGRIASPLPEPIYIAVDDMESNYKRAGAAGASLSTAVVPDVGPLSRIAQRPFRCLPAATVRNHEIRRRRTSETSGLVSLATRD